MKHRLLALLCILALALPAYAARQVVLEERDKQDLTISGQNISGRLQFYHDLHRMAFYAVFDGKKLMAGKFQSGFFELVLKNAATKKTYTLLYPFTPGKTQALSGTHPDGFKGGSFKRPADYYFYGNLPDDVPQKWLVSACFTLKTGTGDRIASLPDKTIELVCISGDASKKMEHNRNLWKKQAEKGNPLERQIYDTTLTWHKTFSPAMDKLHPWGYPGKANDTFKAAYAASEPGSPFYRNPQTLRFALDGIEFLIAELDEHGAWWYPKRRKWKSNDTNTNRFTLYPLMDAVWCLSRLPEYREKVGIWKPKLRKAADLQVAVYKRGLAGNRSGKQEDPAKFGLPKEFAEGWGGRYLNQDVMILLIETFAGKLFQDPKRLNHAREILAEIAKQSLPGGGFHYIFNTNESPAYHWLNISCIARYATVTGDKAALELIGRHENYWLNVMTQEGTAECWSDVWWKQGWSETALPALVIAAACAPNRGPELDRLVSNWMQRNPPCRDYDHTFLYAAPFWRGFQDGKATPEQSLFYDAGARVYRGRNGNWYYGLGPGRQMRNRFSGAVLSRPDSIAGFDSAMDGANIRITPKSKNKREEFFLANAEWDKTIVTMKELPGRAVMMKVRYTPQPHRGTTSLPTEDSPWQVTQTLLAAPSGMYGVITAEATRETDFVEKITGELSVVRHYLRRTDENSFRIGGLNIRIYDSFAKPETGRGGWNGKEAVVMELPVKSAVKKGARYTFAYWIGPGKAPDMKIASGGRGFRVILPDGKTIDAE